MKSTFSFQLLFNQLYICPRLLLVLLTYHWISGPSFVFCFAFLLHLVSCAPFVGDLGQSYDSNKTLTHYALNPSKGKTVLFVGDLSYADNYPNHDNTRWDTWARFVERITAYQPWIWTAGNHELDFAPEIVSIIHGFLCSGQE